MSLPVPDYFGDYLVFVHESGGHGLAQVDRDYPIFAQNRLSPKEVASSKGELQNLSVGFGKQYLNPVSTSRNAV